MREKRKDTEEDIKKVQILRRKKMPVSQTSEPSKGAKIDSKKYLDYLEE